MDGAGNVYVVGGTLSLDYPIVNASQPMNAGGQDAFVTKLVDFGVTSVPALGAGQAALLVCLLVGIGSCVLRRETRPR